MFTDHYAVEKFKQLVKEFGIKTVVETGTYKGDSTVEIAKLVPNTVSIEIVPERFESTKKRFVAEGYEPVGVAKNKSWLIKDKREVTLYCGNSPEVIRRIINRLNEPILFYLDAHWRKYWPLKDEIRAIKPRPKSLIIVHDCRVPGKDFFYDIWLSGANEYETIKDDLAYVNPNYKIFYNERAAGSYCGILYAVPPYSSPAKRREMKVLVVSTMIFPCGGDMRYQGIERLAYYIAGELNHRGHHVSVAAPQGSRFPKGIDHVNTGPCGDFVEAEKRAYGIYSPRMLEFDACLDFSHSHWCMMENDLPAIAFIWHDPNIMKPQEPSYNICALSNWQAIRFRQIYGYEARVVDPHCGHAGEPKPQTGSFLFLGKIGPQKGCLEAIEICHELGVPLDIVGTPGPGDPPEYLEKVKASCNDKVVYRGQVDDSAKMAFLEEARALIYPLNYAPGQGEAHSHKIVDALLCGCPVVTYNTGAFAEIIDHGITGFLASDRDEFKELIMKVDSLDRNLIKEKAVKRWSIATTVDRIIPVMEAVANGERWGNVARGPTIITPSAPSAVGYTKYMLGEYPRQIRLDTINRCNARCLPCHYCFQKRPHGQMSTKLLLKIINDIKGWDMPLNEIVPVNFGEFFLLKNWYEVLRLIEDNLPNTRIALPTNGFFLSDELVQKLASIKTLKWVNFSVNAFFKETYEAFTGLKAETIDMVKRALDKLTVRRPDVTTCVSMIFDTAFQTEIERDLFVRLWGPLASTVSINAAAYCNSPLKSPAIPVKTACRSIFDGLTILYDGTVVTGCCFDASGELIVGDFNNQTLTEIWRGEKLRQLCELHNKGRRLEIELCSRCSFA